MSLIFLRLSEGGISSQNPSICLLLLTVDAQQTKSKQKVGKIKKIINEDIRQYAVTAIKRTVLLLLDRNNGSTFDDIT